jgi:pectate lyase
MAYGNGWGDIGESSGASPKLRLPENLSDPHLLFALLELHRASGKAAFLGEAEAIGRNILKQRVHDGWFVTSQRHVFCRMANDESQALLHLAAALMGKPEAVPMFTGAEPFFHAEYGTSIGRVYDSADIYGKTRQP